MKKTTITALLFLAACATVGHDFDMANVSKLQPGISTEADAKALFGEPMRVTRSPRNNHELLTWGYVYGTGLGTGGGKRLSISFDENGKMLKVIEEAKI